MPVVPVVLSIRRAVALAVPLGLLAPLGATAVAAPKHSSSILRVAQHPAFTRIVVDVPDGVTLGAGEADIEAMDAAPADGRAVVRATAPGLAVRATDSYRAGVRVRLRARHNGLTVLVTARRQSLKFLSYSTARSGTRLVIDLWRNTTARAATILNDGCLRIDRWSLVAGAVRARGRELTPLFEHGLVLSLRREGPGRALIAEKPLIATEGTFLPDFSGYAVPGRWSGRLPYALVTPGGAPPRLRAMLEAWSSSAKDGSLDCLVQVPVILR